MSFKSLLFITLVLTIISTTAFASDSKEQMLSIKLSSITNAIPIKKKSPIYPDNERRTHRDGWVRVSYVIEDNGFVSNAFIIDSSGSINFERASLRAIKRWQFSPAIENGQPIQQCKNDIQFDFKMAKPGYRKSFYAQYQKFLNFYTDKNLVAACKGKSIEEILADKNVRQAYSMLSVLKDKKNTFLENDLYHYTRYLLAQLLDLEAEQLNQLSAMNLHDQTHLRLDPNFRMPLLYEKMILQINANALAEALVTYNTLVKVKEAKPYLAQLTKIKANIDAFIASDKDIAIDAKLNSYGTWSQKLLRNDISINNIQGELASLDIRCDNKRHVYSVKKNNIWSIPEAWQGCMAYIKGDAKASFTFYQHQVDSKTLNSSQTN